MSLNKSGRPDPQLEADFDIRAKNVEQCLNELEQFLSPLEKTTYSTIHETISPLDRARYDLTAAYTLNSLMWSYLRTRGIDPKQTQLKPELDRVKSYMEKMKMIIDKQDAPKVDKSAAVRLLRNALWQKAQGKNTKTDSETNENSDMTT